MPTWAKPFLIAFANGGMGVMIFLVLSGFLITTLLLREQDKSGTISLRNFYARRFARIFPAAYVYLAFIILLKLLSITPISWTKISFAGTFLWNYSNILGFPVREISDNVLGHFWSLSLEEQFYVFWPGLLLILPRRAAFRLSIAAVVLVPVFRLISYKYVLASHGQLGEMFHTAADQMFWGVLTAFAFRNNVHLLWQQKSWLRKCSVAYVTFALFVPVGAIPGGERFLAPTLYCSAAAVFILWQLSGTARISGIVLESRPLRYIGTLSYSLYIWQQFFVARNTPLPFNRLLAIPLAFIAAAASYYLIENPLRWRLRKLLVDHA